MRIFCIWITWLLHDHRDLLKLSRPRKGKLCLNFFKRGEKVIWECMGKVTNGDLQKATGNMKCSITFYMKQMSKFQIASPRNEREKGSIKRRSQKEHKGWYRLCYVRQVTWLLCTSVSCAVKCGKWKHLPLRVWGRMKWEHVHSMFSTGPAPSKHWGSGKWK